MRLEASVQMAGDSQLVHYVFYVSAIRSPLEAMALFRHWNPKSIQFNNLHGMNIYQYSLGQMQLKSSLNFYPKFFTLLKCILPGIHDSSN